MTDLYLYLVIHKRRTCDPTNKKLKLVPKAYRAAVIEELKALGLDLNGDEVREETDDHKE